MTQQKGRTASQLQYLKQIAWDFAKGGLSNQAILERLSSLDMGPVSPRSLRRWLAEKFEGLREEVMQAASEDVLYLRARAFRATADTEINRAFIMERAYWWGLYISALHIVLREALKQGAADPMPPQFIVSNLKQWYADLRALRQLKPKLEMDPEEVDKMEEDLDAFEKHYGRDIKLPKETL